MKIASFESYAVDLTSAPEPIRGTPGELLAAFVVLKLRTDDGLEGVSYAGFIPRRMLRALQEAVDSLAAAAVGSDALRIEDLAQRLLFEGGHGSPGGLVQRAVSAIDVALWDIRGKAFGQPVWRLLGGFRDRVPAYASGGLWRSASADDLRRQAASFAEQGFRTVKMRMGDEATVEAEMRRFEAVREAVGPEIGVMVDINQGWDANRAIEAGREFDRLGAVWLEDPIHFEDYAGLRRIADALKTPVCAGEYGYGLRPLGHLLERGAVDVLMIDLLRAGGLTGWMKGAHLAESFNIPVVTHLATEAMPHGAAAVPNAQWAEHMPWSFPLFTEEPRMEKGEIVLSDEPGIGFQLNQETLERYGVR